MAAKPRELIKWVVNKFLGVFGLKAVKADTLCIPYQDYEKNGPPIALWHFNELLAAYAYLFEHFVHQTLTENPLRHKIMGRSQGSPAPEAFFLVNALQKTAAIAGDVCELGVAQGETSALIANEIRSSNKSLHLFDSFAGLPKPTEKDVLINDIFGLKSLDKYQGTMSNPESLVMARLSAVNFPAQRYVLHKGFFEQVVQADKNLPRQVSFAYLDFDFYEPTRVGLEFLHGVTPSGAIIIVDDYGYFSSGAQTAVDEFMAEKNAEKPTYKIEKPDPAFGLFVIIEKL
jgi:O-methyltransferase